MQMTNTLPSGVGSATLQAQPMIVNGGTGSATFYCPTQRSPALKSGPAASMINQATRTSSTCFMRGYSETLRISTSSSIPWFHRRICFTTKDLVFRGYATSDTPLNNDVSNISSSRGYVRTWINQFQNGSTGATYAQRLSLLFKGAEGVDWDTANTAKVDTTRVSVKYDKTTIIRSSNERGTFVSRKYWHGMNKNLVYDDDEIADVTAASVYSVTDNRGMGDYYICDFFTPGTGATSSDLIEIRSNSTLYWHEK